MIARPSRQRKPPGDEGGARATRPRDRSGLLGRAEALAATLPPLVVGTRRVASTVSQGVHGRRRVGQGETFWQFRHYEPGLATDSIDWRQSAKGDHVYVRDMEWEASQSVWLWRDGSASMHWTATTARPSKHDRAELLLLALAALLARGGEHLALLDGGEQPAPGRWALRRMAAAMATAPSDSAGGKAAGGGGEQRPGLPRAVPLPRFARLVLIGDFFEQPEAVGEAIAGFARRDVQGHLLQVIDPAEALLPFEGRVLFRGLEGEGELLFGRVGSVREDYRALFAQHRQALGEAARRYGWSFSTHATDQPPQTALLALWSAVAGPRL